MEELNRPKADPTASLIITLLFLIAMAVPSIGMLVLATRGVEDLPASPSATTAPAGSQPAAAPTVSPSETRRVLARLAWLSTALLALTILMAFWVVTRHMMQLLSRGRRRKPTPYVDAWAVAGQRAKPVPAESDEEGQG